MVILSAYVRDAPITYIGGPTALLEYAGLRILIDPTFDEPASYPSPGTPLVKTGGPALPSGALEPIDLVLSPTTPTRTTSTTPDASSPCAFRSP